MMVFLRRAAYVSSKTGAGFTEDIPFFYQGKLIEKTFSFTLYGLRKSCNGKWLTEPQMALNFSRLQFDAGLVSLSQCYTGFSLASLSHS